MSDSALKERCDCYDCFSSLSFRRFNIIHADGSVELAVSLNRQLLKRSRREKFLRRLPLRSSLSQSALQTLERTTDIGRKLHRRY